MPPKRNQWKKVENQTDFFNFKRQEAKSSKKNQLYCTWQTPIIHHCISKHNQCYICSKTIKTISSSMEVFDSSEMGPLWRLSQEELKKHIEIHERFIKLRENADVSRDNIDSECDKLILESLNRYLE